MAQAGKQVESHGGLGGGMVHDQPRHLIQDGFFDARDVLVDKPGLVRKRGGTRTIMPIEERTFPEHVGYYGSGDTDKMRALYAAASQNAHSDPFIAAAAVGASFRKHTLTALTQTGRPFRYGQTICFPQFIPNTSCPPLLAVAGSTFRRTTNLETLTAASMAVTATSAEVVIPVADAEKAQPGRIIYFTDAATTPFLSYFGRIVRRNAAGTRIYVDPPVPFTDGALADASVMDYYAVSGSQVFVAGARVGCSFQNRVVLGGITTTGTGSPLVPERLVWSVLPGETTTLTAGGNTQTWHGLVQISGAGFDTDNYLNLPHLVSIVAVVPAGPSELLVFGPQGADRITGTLQTLGADVATDAIGEVSATPLSGSVGCISDRMVQETPFGVVWAAQDGIYLYDGNQMRNVMDRRIQTFWSELQGRDEFEVYGSALVRGDHYIVSTSDATLMLNVRTGGWTRLRDDLTITSATSDPLNPSRIYASNWTDPEGALPDVSNDQMFRLDTIMQPTGSNAVDHDGVAIEPYLETRAYHMGDPARLKRLRRLVAMVDLKSAALDEAGTLTGLNNDAQALLDLPNLDAEFGSTDHWRATGATASTVTAATAAKNSGAYSIKVVTGATGGGVSYDFPGMISNANCEIAIEAYVYLSSAGTLTLDFGGTTTTTAVTGAWTRLAVTEFPGAVNVLNYAIAFTHSATGATFYVDDVKAAVLMPWESNASTNGLVSGATALLDSTTAPLGLEQSLRVTSADATANTGIAHKTLRLPAEENETLTGRIWLKNDAGNPSQSWQLRVGGVNIDTLSSESTAATVTPTEEWARFEVEHVATHKLKDLFVCVRKTSTTSATVNVALATITTADPECDVAVIGGFVAEGDYGDGSQEDIDFSELTTAYEGILNGSTVSVSGGALVPSSTSAKAFAFRKGFATSRDGEATVTYVPGHASDRMAILVTVLDANNYLFLEANGAGIASIQKVEGGSFTNLTDPATSPAAETLGVQYWLRGVRRGRLLTVEHWTSDPALGGDVDPIVEHYLSDADAAVFADKGRLGFRFQPGDTTMRVKGFRCEPYGNVAIAGSDPSAPIGVRGDMHVQTRAATVCYRTIGASSECEFGAIDLHFNPLNPSRTT
jgi:hypothetical protein